MRLFHLVLFTTLPACGEELADTKPTGDTGSPAEPDDIAIAGTYLDAFGSEQVITNETWTQTYAGYDPLVFAVASYDNTERVVIAQNGDTNTFDPGAWSRFDWVDAADGHLYYCQSAFDAATEQIAVDTPRADDSDPAGAGCGGFGWTDLTP